MAQASQVVRFVAQSNGEMLGARRISRGDGKGEVEYVARFSKDGRVLENYGRFSGNFFYAKSLKPEELPDVRQGHKLVVHEVSKAVYEAIEISNDELASAMRMFEQEPPLERQYSGHGGHG